LVKLFPTSKTLQLLNQFRRTGTAAGCVRSPGCHGALSGIDSKKVGKLVPMCFNRSEAEKC